MSSDLPSGTVTFVFTDIEGSTLLLEEVGDDGYAELLSEHHRACRAAWVAHGGTEVDTAGDAFFVAFSRASDALRAAAAAQEALAATPLRVRMGLHTGEATLTDTGYVGLEVHRAARIAAAAHGGQVVVSSSTAAVVGADGLRDLGVHRFKDLAAPERVYQLGEGDFPPLKSLYRNNLPVPATPFLGREQELAAVVGLLARDDVRLITLTGPGGTGKTRLALQAAAESAEHFPDGVWWVPLASIRDPALVLTSVARSLEVQEEPGRPLPDVLARRLAGKQLILLDNLEHLLPDAADVVGALHASAGPTFLVTSRERLRIQPEHAYAVPSLSDHDGSALFLARARQVDSAFSETAAVAELCRRLDGLPLALELAAARTVVFSPDQLLVRLGERLDLLKGGRDADPRQETLRATIAWSYELLTPREQQLFAGLSIFAGGCTYEAAEQVCDADPDTLQSLLDKSLLRRRVAAADVRYWMLETIREFAAEQLAASGEPDDYRRRHGELFASFAERADPNLRHGPDQHGWADRVAVEYDNLRSAIRFGLDVAPELALRIVGSIAFFVWLRGGFAEARGWVEDALARGAGAPVRMRAKVLECGAVVAERQGDFVAATRYADDAFAASVEAGDEPGMASALREQGKAAMQTDDHERAIVIYDELSRLAERIGDAWNGAIALNNLGDLALYAGNWDRTVELCGRSSELRFGMGDDWGGALALVNVGVAQLQLGRLERRGRESSPGAGRQPRGRGHDGGQRLPRSVCRTCVSPREAA